MERDLWFSKFSGTKPFDQESERLDANADFACPAAGRCSDASSRFARRAPRRHRRRQRRYPLFDKDSLSVEAGPTAQQVVIHAGSGAAVRKHVAELNPTHPEVTYPAPKKGEPGDVNTDYPLPSPQALAAAASSRRVACRRGGLPGCRLA
jgi:hypothetical protein